MSLKTKIIIISQVQELPKIELQFKTTPSNRLVFILKYFFCDLLFLKGFPQLLIPWMGVVLTDGDCLAQLKGL